MMNHDKSLLSKYLSGEMREDEMEQLEDHLVECETCLQQLHDLMEENETIDNYLLKKLSPEATDAFERHYFMCQTCFDEMKAQERVINALQAAKKLDLLPETTKKKARNRVPINEFIERVFGWLPRSVLVPALAALALLLIYPAWRGLFELPRKLETWQQPRANVAMLHLTAERAAGAKITLRPEDTFFVLTFYLDEIPATHAYQARLIDQSGKILWQGKKLQPVDEYGNYSLSCPTGIFSSGDYKLQITEIDTSSGKEIRSQDLPFSVELRGK
ncbi:MAG: zf-HC2 domain-containing protein [Calditrichaeota bacterium]|nr:MAG: zf-HC2 domain-containing protein [Calditrichota bacterium]